MSMRVTFLGTSGAVPTTQRAPSAVLVNREGERFLFD
ncbi:MAG: MBL fold metallo-hydrolase, partial [Haloglomus sp.]